MRQRRRGRSWRREARFFTAAPGDPITSRVAGLLAVVEQGPFGSPRAPSIADRLLQLLHHLIDRERGGSLARREILEACQELARRRLRTVGDVGVVHHPVPVGIGGDVGAFEGICPEVEELGNAKLRERLGPNSQRPGRSLFHEYDLPVFESQRDYVTVVVEVEKLVARRLVLLTGQVRQLVVTIEVK